MRESEIDWTNWRGEILATLMFIERDGELLLIEKLTGIGEGKINGPGGKIDPGETAEQAVIRECQEELHVTPKQPVKMGELHFAMSDIPDIHCHVFMSYDFDGVPTATREANPRWTKLSEIPFDRMWEDDRYWLPQMLEGQVFNGKFEFEGEEIQWMEVEFGESAKEQWLGESVDGTSSGLTSAD
ncbi:8-oxo-dGTP diphosphatase [Rubritalea marina]|uniref:8-oxo-dGTP diphosphatase n=1 Tax=Rubritalea marina TaxID=361055 RepID=UPI00039A6E1E|nr:8-oxo-dGTP diphosphatase [Rubritalea marina]